MASCARSNNFGAQVTIPYDNIVIEGQGNATFFRRDGNNTVFSDGGHDNVLFINIGTDVGGIERAGSDSYIISSWIGGDYTSDQISMAMINNVNATDS